MKRAILAAAAALATLVFANAALAANTGTVVISHSPAVLGQSVATTIHVTLPQAQDPPAAINIFAPAGYTANLTAAAATSIGNVEATAFSYDNNLTLPLTGSVSTDTPSKYAAVSQQCAGTPSSAAVWLLNLSVAGQTVVVPLFVNATVGAEQALGAYKLSICLPPPDVPQGTPGRAVNGVQLLDAKFTVNGIFTTPSTAGLIRWESLVTPYVPKTGQVNRAGTFEVRSLIGLPVQATLSGKYVKKTKKYTVSGKVTAGGTPLAGAVALLTGTKPTSLKKTATLTASATGSYSKSGTQKAKKTTYFKVTVTTTDTNVTSTGCQQPLPATVAPAGCVSATLTASTASSAVVRVKS